MGIEREQVVYIAGASSRAKTAKGYIEYLSPNTKVMAFFVSQEMDDNPTDIDGIPVVSISNEEIEKNGIDLRNPVYIATRGVNHAKLEAELRELGFIDVRPIDVHLDSYMRNEYVKRNFAATGKSFTLLENLSDGGARNASIMGKIYVASSVNDSALRDDYTLQINEEALQVGVSMTEERLPGIENLDNSGKGTENISSLNSQFCELTGLYWIWKNTTEDYVGLAHYRRQFLLPDNWIRLCDANSIDVILPVPLYVSPSVEQDYRIRHVSEDWDVLMDYFKNSLPDEYEQALEFFSENLYSPCNMLIARRDVLNELCQWLFSIVFTVYKRIGDKTDAYQRRYPGFMSERLISYFFTTRRDRYKVVYANKNFLS